MFPIGNPAPLRGRKAFVASHWAKLSALGIDLNRRLYWHGQPIELGPTLVLSAAQKAWGIVLATGALLAFLATFVQGRAAAMTWMCQVGWIHTWCTAG